MKYIYQIVHVGNIPTMQFFSGISRNTPSELTMQSSTQCVRNFQNNTLRDTRKHVLLAIIRCCYALTNIELELVAEKLDDFGSKYCI
mgnify:CR=1 FL=1